MSVGKKETDKGVIRFLRFSVGKIAKIAGFSLIEILIVVLILSVILTAIFMVFSIGNFSFMVTSEKLDVQSDVRLAMNWIFKDLRQAISWNVADSENNPDTGHLKFFCWSWDESTNNWVLSGNYIEYTYDQTKNTLTRLYVPEEGQPMSLVFNNIIESPFYTTYVGPGNSQNILDADQLRSNRRLIVVISGRKSLRSGMLVPYKVISEVKIRNG